MAKKIDKATAPQAMPAQPINELEVLHPERVITLGALKVTVREFGHIEWMRLLPRAEPMVQAIAHHLAAGVVPTYEQAFEVLAMHVETLMPLVAQAADLTAEQVDKLRPDEGELLLMTWWGVNGRFFVQRALNRVAVGREEARKTAAVSAPKSELDGEKSTPPLSPTTTAAAS
jgi:hypothetical protein